MLAIRNINSFLLSRIARFWWYRILKYISFILVLGIDIVWHKLIASLLYWLPLIVLQKRNWREIGKCLVSETDITKDMLQLKLRVTLYSLRFKSLNNFTSCPAGEVFLTFGVDLKLVASEVSQNHHSWLYQPSIKEGKLLELDRNLFMFLLITIEL